MIDKIITHSLEWLSKRKKSNMIEAHCYTNLEGYSAEKWPSKFPILPMKGNRIESKSGKYLYVAQVEFTAKNDKGFTNSDEDVATIRIELHKMPLSLNG